MSARCSRNRIVSPRSHAPQVPSSTPRHREASFIDHPIARRLAIMHSGILLGTGNGSYPKKLKMSGMALIGGSVFPFSQFKTVNEVTSSTSPTFFCERPSSSRLFLIRSPRVWGSKSKGFFLNDLRQTRTNGRKATRP